MSSLPRRMRASKRNVGGDLQRLLDRGVALGLFGVGLFRHAIGRHHLVEGLRVVLDHAGELLAQHLGLGEHVLHIGFGLGIFLFADGQIADHADKRRTHCADDGGDPAAARRRRLARQRIEKLFDPVILDRRHAISFASA